MTGGDHGAADTDMTISEREGQVQELSRSLGENHPATLAALYGLMQAHRAAADFAGALAAGERTLASVRQTRGPLHPATLELVFAIASWRNALGDFDAATAELEGLIPLLESELGPHHEKTLAARHTLASCVGRERDPVVELGTWTKLFADEHRILGAEHPDTLTARHNIASWRKRLGDAIGARDEIGQVLTIRRRLLGDDHPDTLTSRLLSATCRGEAGDTGGAVAEVAELLPLLRNVFGDHHVQTLTARHVCAMWGHGTGQQLEAVSDWAVLVDDQRQALGPDHALTVAGRAALAARRAKWEALLDEYEYLAIDLYRDMAAEESGDELTADGAACAAADGAAQRSESEDLLERVIAAKKKIASRTREFDEDSEPVLSARYELACQLWKGQEFDSAADHTQRLIDDCLRAVGEQHELTRTARHLLAAGRSCAGRDDEPDPAYPFMTVVQMNQIRRYAAEVLSECGVEAGFNAEGTALMAPGGVVYGLDNVVAACRHAPPGEWQRIVTNHVATVRRAVNSLPGADDMEWAELSTRVRSRVVSGAQIGESGDMLSYAWPVAEGLFEVLCLDFPDVVKYLNGSQLAGLDVDRLREVAHRNTIAEPIEIMQIQESGGANLHLLQGESSFIASKVLDLETLVPTYIRDASHGVVVGVPARNYLILHPVETAGKLFAAINAMANICPSLSANQPGAVSPNMYFWKGGKLQCISRVEADTGQVSVDVSGALAETLAALGG